MSRGRRRRFEYFSAFNLVQRVAWRGLCENSDVSKKRGNEQCKSTQGDEQDGREREWGGDERKCDKRKYGKRKRQYGSNKRKYEERKVLGADGEGMTAGRIHNTASRT
jgi:hypothetical protein